MMLKPATLAWAAVAIALVAAVHGSEPPQAGAGGFVSTRSSARRVFPTLSDITLETASLTLARSDGASVVLKPSADGHALHVDGVMVGPADPRAVEGLWASLRMATTVRAVSDAAGVGVGSLGTITIEADGVLRTLRVGARTPDDAGRYAEIDNADFDPEGPQRQTWVVEAEMADILDQAPEAWLSRRAVLVEPGQVLVLKVPGGEMRRGEDGRWRSTAGDDPQSTALLSTDAVEARLGRMISARLSPLLPGGASQPAQPWVSLEGTGARRWTLSLAGPCPDGSARTVLVRGEGWPGCIDEALTGTWPLPGTEDPDAGSLLEPRLSPYGYGRVLRIEQRLPTRQALARNAGDWRLSTDQGDHSVDGPDVFAWYATVHDAEVELAPLGTAAPQWAVDLEMTTDTTQHMRLRCGPQGPQRICQRDNGPLLRLLTAGVRLATDVETFADRDLLRLAVDDVRALEIIAEGRPRQSVHFDLGVWRLDAPAHPEGDAALSDVLLGEVLAAASSVRVQSWVPRPPGPPLRTLRLEQVPEAGRDTVLVLALWPDPEDAQGCIAALGEQAGRLTGSVCDRLQQDLLHTDPVKFWLDTARSIEVTVDGHTSRFERTVEGLVGEGPEVEADMQRLRALAQRRLQSLEALPEDASEDADPQDEAAWTLRVLPKQGERITATVGRDVVSLDGLRWRYRLAPVR